MKSLFLNRARIAHRFLRRKLFIATRCFAFLFWKLWIRRIDGLENIPRNEGAVIFANHQSYLDFLAFRPILKNNCVFVANKKLRKQSVINWFMRYGTVIYVDLENPGFRLLKELMRCLKSGKQLVIYPEGTRSRSGSMASPKIGFVKLALKNNVPLVPVALKGTYDVWPHDRQWPRLRRFDILIKEKIYLSPLNGLVRDVFCREKGVRKYDKLSRQDLRAIAFRLMNIVRESTGQDWDESAKGEADFLCRSGYEKVAVKIPN